MIRLSRLMLAFANATIQQSESFPDLMPAEATCAGAMVYRSSRSSRRRGYQYRWIHRPSVVVAWGAGSGVFEVRSGRQTSRKVRITSHAPSAPVSIKADRVPSSGLVITTTTRQVVNRAVPITTVTRRALSDRRSPVMILSAFAGT